MWTKKRPKKGLSWLNMIFTPNTQRTVSREKKKRPINYGKKNRRPKKDKQTTHPEIFPKAKKRQKMRQDTGVICSSLEWNKYTHTHTHTHTHTIHEITEDKKTDFLLYSLSVMFKVEMAKRKQYQTMLWMACLRWTTATINTQTHKESCFAP